MLQSKHNSKCGKEKQHPGSRKAQQQQRHRSKSLQQDTAKKHTAESYTASNSAQPTHTTERETTAQDTAAPHHQRCSWTTTASCRSTSWRRLLAQRRPILEESTRQATHTAFYTPEQTHDGPDIKRLTPCKQTKVQPAGGRATQDWRR